MEKLVVRWLGGFGWLVFVVFVGGAWRVYALQRAFYTPTHQHTHTHTLYAAFAFNLVDSNLIMS